MKDIDLTENRSSFETDYNYKLPPCNVDAEEGILGAALVDPNIIDTYKLDEYLAPGDFYIGSHEKLWRAFLNLKKQGKSTDLATVADYLEAKGKLESMGGLGWLATLVERTVTSVNSDRYARLIKEKAVRRQLIALCNDFGQRAHDHYLELPQLLETFEEEAQTLTRHPNIDNAETAKDKEFQTLIDQIKKIMLEVADPARREWELCKLSKKAKISKGDLATLYHKSLIKNNNGKSLTISELKEQYGNEVQEWLIHGWLPKGSVSLLHARGGTGKSLLSYDFAFHLAVGEDWNKYPVLDKSKGLIIQSDETEADLVSHLNARGIDETFDIKFKTEWSIDYIPQLYEEIKREGYDWVFIDSLTSVSRVSCVEENGVEYARPILQLSQIASELNTHLLLLHHSNKADGSARGSTAIEAAVSQVIKLDRDPKKAHDKTLRIATFTKSRSRRPGSYEIRLNPDNPDGIRNYWTVESEIDAADELNLDGTWKDKVIGFLKANPNTPFEIREINEEIGGNQNTIRKVVGALANERAINSLDRGKKPNLYFLGKINGSDILSRNRRNPSDPPGDRKGSHEDHQKDHIENLTESKPVAVDDPAILKNAKNLSSIEQEKNSENEGSRINNSHIPTETGDRDVILMADHNSDLSDPGGDQGDHPCDSDVTVTVATPIEKWQFFKAQEDYQRIIYFVDAGDFWECYDQDAEIVRDQCEIIPIQRDGHLCCGIPKTETGIALIEGLEQSYFIEGREHFAPQSENEDEDSEFDIVRGPARASFPRIQEGDIVATRHPNLGLGYIVAKRGDQAQVDFDGAIQTFRKKDLLWIGKKLSYQGEEASLKRLLKFGQKKLEITGFLPKTEQRDGELTAQERVYAVVRSTNWHEERVIPVEEV